MVRSRPASPSWAPCLPASTPPPHRKAPSRAEHRYRGCQSFLRSSSLPPQEIHPAALAASLNSTVLFYPLCLSPKNCLQGSSEDAVPQSPRPAPERPPRLPNPTQDPVLPLHPLCPGAPPPVPAGLRKETTALFTSANRSIKTRWPAFSRTRNLAPGMAPARAAALTTGT